MQINPRKGVAVLGGKPAEHKRKKWITHTLWGSLSAFCTTNNVVKTCYFSGNRACITCSRQLTRLNIVIMLRRFKNLLNIITKINTTHKSPTTNTENINEHIFHVQSSIMSWLLKLTHFKINKNLLQDQMKWNWTSARGSCYYMEAHQYSTTCVVSYLGKLLTD